jgi:hypothetical protein
MVEGAPSVVQWLRKFCITNEATLFEISAATEIVGDIV